MTKAKKLRQLFDVAFLLFILIFFGETVITALAYDENKSDGILGLSGSAFVTTWYVVMGASFADRLLAKHGWSLFNFKITDWKKKNKRDQ